MRSTRKFGRSPEWVRSPTSLVLPKPKGAPPKLFPKPFVSLPEHTRQDANRQQHQGALPRRNRRTTGRRVGLWVDPQARSAPRRVQSGLLGSGARHVPNHQVGFFLPANFKVTHCRCHHSPITARVWLPLDMSLRKKVPEVAPKCSGRRFDLVPFVGLVGAAAAGVPVPLRRCSVRNV